MEENFNTPVLETSPYIKTWEDAQVRAKELIKCGFDVIVRIEKDKLLFIISGVKAK